MGTAGGGFAGGGFAGGGFTGGGLAGGGGVTGDGGGVTGGGGFDDTGSTFDWKYPSTLPAAEYRQTTMLPCGQPVPPRPVLQTCTAHPRVLLPRHTTCVKWPVAELKPGLLKL